MKPVSGKHAFTLIEVLVASVIAALLATTVLGLTVRLESHDRALADRMRNHQQNELLVEIMRRDILQAETIRVEPSGLQLTGAMATGELGRPLSQYAEVQYYVDDRTCLWREQISGDRTREGSSVGRTQAN